MKIYTKTGDLGETSLLSGKRLKKHDLRIEAYGTVDELNSNVGLLMAEIQSPNFLSELNYVQDRLFTIGSELAVDKKISFQIPHIVEGDVELLEHSIDQMNLVLPEMKTFILPAGSRAIAVCHIVRTVCRRAERRVTELAESAKISPIIIRYLNRLSDYLFVLSRWIAHESSVSEIPWKPKIT